MPRASQRFGIQALRSLGLRITELVEMSPQSAATIKRYTRTVIPELRMMVSALTPVHSQHREVLTDFWVRIIAENRQIGPPVSHRRFLDFFVTTRDSPRGMTQVLNWPDVSSRACAAG